MWLSLSSQVHTLNTIWMLGQCHRDAGYNMNSFSYLKTHIDYEIIMDKLCINLSNWVFIFMPVSFFGLLWFNGLEMIFNY